MNNARFGTLANLYHQPRQPMQGGQMQQPMQGQPQQGAPNMQSFMGQMIGMPQQQQRRPMQGGQQGGSAMNAIIAQLMQRGR